MDSKVLSIKASIKLGSNNLDYDHQFDLSQITGVYGPSGIGKTTMIRIITGLQTCTKAQVIFHHQIWQSESQFIPTYKRNIGHMIQEGGLFPHLNVRGNLNFAYKRSTQKIKFDRIVEMLDLKELLERNIDQLSGGQRQRVALARTLLTSPQILILDEPFNALDDQTREHALLSLKKLHEEFNIPIILVSHNRVDLQLICERIIELS